MQQKAMPIAALPMSVSAQLYDVELAAYQARRAARVENVDALKSDRMQLQAALNHCDVSLATLHDLQACVTNLDAFSAALPQHRFVAAIQAADAVTQALARLQPLRGALALIDVLAKLAWQQQQDGRMCVEAVKAALEPYVTGVTLLADQDENEVQALQLQLSTAQKAALISTSSEVERARLSSEIVILEAFLSEPNLTTQLVAGCRLIQTSVHQQELIDWICTTQLVVLRRDMTTCIRKASTRETSQKKFVSPFRSGQVMPELYSQGRMHIQRFRDEVGRVLPEEWQVTRRIIRETIRLGLRPMVDKHLAAMIRQPHMEPPPLVALSHAVQVDAWVGEAEEEEEHMDIDGLLGAFLPWRQHIVRAEFAYPHAWLATIEQQNEWNVDARDLTCRFSASQQLLLLLRKLVSTLRKTGAFADRVGCELLYDACTRALLAYVKLIEQQVVACTINPDAAFLRTLWAAVTNTCIYLETQQCELHTVLFGSGSGSSSSNSSEKGKENAFQLQCDLLVVQGTAALSRDVCGREIHTSAIAPLDEHVRKCSTFVATDDASEYAKKVVVTLTQLHAPLATLPLLNQVLISTAKLFFDTWGKAIWETRTKVSVTAARQLLVDLDLIRSFWSSQTKTRPSILLNKTVAALVTPWKCIFQTLGVDDAQLIGLFQALHSTLDAAAQATLLERILDLRGLTSNQQYKLVEAYNREILDRAEHGSPVSIASPTDDTLRAHAKRWLHDAQQFSKR
jgi:hypothetical protein